jgi:hypothetical protein
MQLTVASDDGTGIGQVFFYGAKQLPRNARVTVDIDSLPEDACAGVIMRNSVKRLGGYALEVCHDGTSAIEVYALKGSPTIENPGPLVPFSSGSVITSCRLTATANDSLLRLRINDNQEFTASDGRFTENDAVSLFITPPHQSGASVSVGFKNSGINAVPS